MGESEARFTLKWPKKRLETGTMEVKCIICVMFETVQTKWEMRLCIFKRHSRDPEETAPSKHSLLDDSYFKTKAYFKTTFVYITGIYSITVIANSSGAIWSEW